MRKFWVRFISMTLITLTEEKGFFFFFKCDFLI